jgi:hypothetical protein
MLEWIQMGRWSPYVVGIAIGVLSWLAFLLSDKPISCSSAFSRTSGMIEKVFRGKKVEAKEYYQQFKPVVEWGWMLVLGVIIGAFVSSMLSGSFRLQWVPDLWDKTFGPAPLPRLGVAFIGGIFMGFASRWTGGCTSGHGISGTLQLAVSSWLAVVFFFIGGIVTAFAIFRFIAI